MCVCNLVCVCLFPVFAGYGQLTKRPRISIDDGSHIPTKESPVSPTTLEDDNAPVTTVRLVVGECRVPITVSLGAELTQPVNIVLVPAATTPSSPSLGVAIVSPITFTAAGGHVFTYSPRTHQPTTSTLVGPNSTQQTYALAPNHNYKNMLQEWAQKKYRGAVIEHELIAYTILPDPNTHIQQHTQHTQTTQQQHTQSFRARVDVFLDLRMRSFLGGFKPTKTGAEQDAARVCLLSGHPTFSHLVAVISADSQTVTHKVAQTVAQTVAHSVEHTQQLPCKQLCHCAVV
jgi:hypothetical protein